MLLMAGAVGVIAGVGAWGFRMLIGFVHNALFLGSLTADYNANMFTPASPWGMFVILVPVAGGLVVASSVTAPGGPPVERTLGPGSTFRVRLQGTGPSNS